VSSTWRLPSPPGILAGCSASQDCLNTCISLFCSENKTEISSGILEKVLEDVQDKESKQQHQEGIICIDNIEIKGIYS
jgi:hypothetical protein